MYKKKQVVQLSKQAIEKLFAECESQSDIIIGIYKQVFPNWDAIDSIDGWPLISKEAALFITEKFIAFDQKHHPKSFAGGLWVNKGFSSNHSQTTGWDVDLSDVKLVLRE